METPVPDQIEREVFIDVPPERLWEILTEAEHIKAWFAFDGCDIDLRPGGELMMRWQEHGTFSCRVERVEPPFHFAYRGCIHPDERAFDHNSTLVEFTITPEGRGSRLRVVESGFRELQLPPNEQAAYAAGNVQGWSGAFAALQEYVRRLAVAA